MIISPFYGQKYVDYFFGHPVFRPAGPRRQASPTARDEKEEEEYIYLLHNNSNP